MTGRRACFPVVAEAMAGMLVTPLWYFGVWIIVTGLLLVAPVLRGRLLAEHLHQQDAAAEHGADISVITPEQPLHNDRYIPLHPQLKTMLDQWLADRPDGLRSDLLFLDRGRPIPPARVDRALTRVATHAGIGNVTAHQLRHTLATRRSTAACPLKRSRRCSATAP